MPRRPRIKTRADHLAEALLALQNADASLHRIDLRTMPRSTAAQYRLIRERTEELLALGVDVLRSDIPPHPTGVSSQRPSRPPRADA